MNKHYIYPALSDNCLFGIQLCGFGIRLGGAGLGNSLLILARAVILAKQYNAELINPDWISIKLGPILRNERDKRLYRHFFKPMGITGVKKARIRLFSPKVNEEQLKAGEGVNGTVIVVGLNNYFDDIRHERLLVCNYILANIHRKNAAEIEGFTGHCIGVHIRMGDLNPQWRVPLEWFAAMITKIRSFLHEHVQVCVFSDGDEHELTPVTRLPHVQRICFQNALTELICLSKCQLILASNSTFSAWAVFLGNKPSVWKYRSTELKNLLCNEQVFDGIVCEDQELPELLKQNLEQLFFENAQA
jgi:hypothetical protein